MRVFGIWDFKIVKVAAGGFHTTVFSEDGRIFAWGLGNHGQLGFAKYLDRNFISTPT